MPTNKKEGGGKEGGVAAITVSLFFVWGGEGFDYVEPVETALSSLYRIFRRPRFYFTFFCSSAFLPCAQKRRGAGGGGITMPLLQHLRNVSGGGRLPPPPLPPPHSSTFDSRKKGGGGREIFSSPPPGGADHRSPFLGLNDQCGTGKDWGGG